MRLSMQLDALEKAREHAEIALSEWRKHMLLSPIPVADARHEGLASFLADIEDAERKVNGRLTDLQFRFATSPVLRATFFNPNNRMPTEDRYIIIGPNRDCDEPHVFEETWICMQKYLQGPDCMVDEDFDVYVVTKRPPHRVVHVIPSCRKAS